jgi:hypothetical protein
MEIDEVEVVVEVPVHAVNRLEVFLGQALVNAVQQVPLEKLGALGDLAYFIMQFRVILANALTLHFNGFVLCPVVQLELGLFDLINGYAPVFLVCYEKESVIINRLKCERFII